MLSLHNKKSKEYHARSNTIWLINQYASTPTTGISSRHYYFAKELAALGYNVYLIAASYTHLLREPLVIGESFKIEEVEGFNFVWVKTPAYKNAHDKKRIISELWFTRKLLKLPNIIPDNPFVILHSSPSLLPYLGVKRISKTLRSRIVWDVRDLWPMTLIELGGMSVNHPFIRLTQWVEDIACRNSDYIISNWPYAIEHLKTRGASPDRFLWIPNGFSKEEFSESLLSIGDLHNKFSKNKFIIGYTGTFGEANALDVLLKVPANLINNTDIHFILVGDGRLKENLQEDIESKQLDNVTLIESVPKTLIPSILNEFDVCYVGFKSSNLYQYGNSLNKLPEYLMSGKPIIYSINSPFNPVNDACAGFTVPAEDYEAISEAIMKLKNMPPDERARLGLNGQKYALENLAYTILAKKMEKVLSGKNDITSNNNEYK